MPLGSAACGEGYRGGVVRRVPSCLSDVRSVGSRATSRIGGGKQSRFLGLAGPLVRTAPLTSGQDKHFSTPDITLQAVICDGHLTGSIASFPAGGQTEVTYWIDRAAWGKGIATRALALLLELVTARPLHARAASDNAGSLRVLQKCGFKAAGTERSFAAGRNEDIEETILRLDT
jgi:GNAT superfamily N-acetyltransferase